ncbi:MAG: hypothetical protein GX173_03815 [Ruminococcaceae bacterium]|nr:hypothetical protein [Oscillospiraceae bacterium]
MHRMILFSVFCFILLPLVLLTCPDNLLLSRHSKRPADVSETATTITKIVVHSTIDMADGASDQMAMSPPLLEANSMISPFTLSAAAQPAIEYYAGQKNSLGDENSLDAQRLLSGEQLNLSLPFSHEPGLIEIRFCDETWRYYGIPGRLNYQVSLIVPENKETLAADGTRLTEAWPLQIRAEALYDNSLTSQCELTGFDVMGDVHGLIRLQPLVW